MTLRTLFRVAASTGGAMVQGVRSYRGPGYNMQSKSRGRKKVRGGMISMFTVGKELDVQRSRGEKNKTKADNNNNNKKPAQNQEANISRKEKKY
jgi:hypothetical protein